MVSNIFFTINFIKIIPLLFKFLYKCLAFSNKLFKFSSFFTINIELMIEYRTFYLQINNFSKFSFKWKWSCNIRLLCIPINSRMFWVINSSSNMTYTLFLFLDVDIWNKDSKTKVYTSWVSVITNHSQTTLIFPISFNTTGSTQRNSFALQIDDITISIDK